MDKELIKKYKPEFDHWLNGGKVLLGNSCNNNVTWHDLDRPFEALKGITLHSDQEFIIIINDEYVEFRKALAEGKTVQYCLSKNYHPDVWYNLDSRVGFHHSPDEYRIKPEEPQFKIGNWVKNNLSDTIFKYTPNTLKPDPSCCELWQPQPDDYAWFYDYEKYTPTFGKFMQIENDKYLAEIADGKGSLHLVAFTYCEPFLNTLPTFLTPE